MSVPLAYKPGFEKACALNPDLATVYLEQTSVADPSADAAVDALASFDTARGHRLIQAGMERDVSVFAQAPRELRDFFEQLETPPTWFDPAAVLPGCRAFHAYSDLFIPAFFVVTLQNAATLISKAFYATGRVKTEHGYRRIRQNTRHFIEIMLPGALERDGEGRKLSIRIRLVHAQVRRLLRTSGDWDESVYGAPLSAAHMGLSSANFSATMLRQATRLGADLDADARTSFMQIWRYASWLIGTPDSLLFEGDEAKTSELYRIGAICEPPPNKESAVIANTLVQALPKIAGLSGPAQTRAMVTHVYRVSRALLGRELADQLQFPRLRTAGLLTWMKWKRQVLKKAHQTFPHLAARWRGSSFEFLLEASKIGDLSYRLPNRVKATESTLW